MKRIIKIRPRKDRQKFEVDYRDHDGKRFRPLFDTEEEALAFAAAKSEELSKAPAPIVEHKDITLSEYAKLKLEAWGHLLAPRTMASYRERLTNHVLPVLGGMRVRDIGRRHVNNLLNLKQRAGRDTRVIRAVLSSLLTDAADDELIGSNPCIGLTRKKRQPRAVSAERTLRVMTDAQWGRFLVHAATLPDRRLAALFHTLSKTGVRPSEGLALKPDDIDFESETLLIERALDLDRTVRPTKTYETRTVELTPELTAALKRYLVGLKEWVLQRGWGDPEWLFPDDDGRPIDERKARKLFKRALKRAGLPGFRLYDLRHTYASLLLADGVPITYVAGQLGHRKPTTTLRYYAHFIPPRGEAVGHPVGTRKWNQCPSASHKSRNFQDSAAELVRLC